MFFVDTGLRRSELIALDWQDVDIKSGLVKSQEAKVVRIGA